VLWEILIKLPANATPSAGPIVPRVISLLCDVSHSVGHSSLEATRAPILGCRPDKAEQWSG
jgi:hypothetical protein